MAKGFDYDAHKERTRERELQQSTSGRDIGEIPEIVDPKRRAYAMERLQNYCEVYHSDTFCWPWSKDHIIVLDKLDLVIHKGGLFANAMPRGSGKTSMCEAGGMFAINKGIRLFPVLLGSTDQAAVEMLESIKIEYETNDLLYEDFPEICHAIRALEGITNRATGQLYQGTRTRIRWAADEIRFPVIPGSPCPYSIMRVAGLTGRVRGMKVKTPQIIMPDGTIIKPKTVRPDLVIADDPQTDESARSASQTKTRLDIIRKAVLKLAGKRKKIAVAMPCTVIQKDDMADQVLDRHKNPEWQGERMKMLYSFPDNLELWDGYAEILIEDMRIEAGRDRANKFYTDNREEMDKGAVVGWEHSILEDEISAVQNAMNQFILDEPTFWAESQNEPKEEHDNEGLLTKPEIMDKLNKYDKLIIPPDCTKITAFIDIHKNALYYLVAAWAEGFTGYIIDYGTYPDQNKSYYRLSDIRHTLPKQFPKAGLEGTIFAGLEELTGRIMGHEYKRHDGAVMRMNACLIDANWAMSQNTVNAFARQSTYSANILPSHGMGITASRQPISKKIEKKGEKIGLEWQIPIPTRRKSRHIVYDTNFWKTFVHSRLSVSMGDSGCLSLFGDKPRRHTMIAEQLLAEYRVQTEGLGRKVWEWKAPSSKPDNHLFDCLVGAAVAASTEGIELKEIQSVSARRKTVSFSDKQKQAKMKRGV